MLKLNQESEKNQDENKDMLKQWLEGTLIIIGSAGQVLIPECHLEFGVLRVWAKQLACILANTLMYTFKGIKWLAIKSFKSTKMLLIALSLLWKRNF